MKQSLGFRMVRHGVLLLFLGLLTGIPIMHVKNPRMGLAAHLEGIMAGMMLLVLGGVVWDRLKFSPCPVRAFPKKPGILKNRVRSHFFE